MHPQGVNPPFHPIKECAMPNQSDYPGTPLHGQPSTTRSSAAPSSSPGSSSFDDERQRKPGGQTPGGGSRESGSGASADLPFDLTDLKERATRTLKTAYEKASGFVRENPRAAAGIGIVLGAMLLRRATRR
jgi:hypothetical protein